jgi:SAM-dependent methyltransferase
MLAPELDRQTRKASARDLAAFAEVERLVAGQMVARAVIIGHKLGVFRQLAAGPLSLDALAQALSVRNARSFGKLIDILAKLRLLERAGTAVRNGTVAELALVPGRPGYYGHFVDFFSRQYITKSEAKLLRFTREGISIDESTDGWDEYMGAMDCMASISADRVARALPLAGTRTLLDLGGGTGAYAAAFCAEYPDIAVTIRDLDAVREIALGSIARSGHAARITFEVGSFLDQAYPASYDAIFISQTIHLFPEHDVLSVMKVAYRFLNPGGRLIIRELFIDEDSKDPLLGLLIGFQMWIEGAAYGLRQVESMMKTAGFMHIERCSILDAPGGPQVVGEMLVGRKAQS